LLAKSITAGRRRPIPLPGLDRAGKLRHFNRARMPERVVHASDSGACPRDDCRTPRSGGHRARDERLDGARRAGHNVAEVAGPAAPRPFSIAGCQRQRRRAC